MAGRPTGLFQHASTPAAKARCQGLPLRVRVDTYPPLRRPIAPRAQVMLARHACSAGEVRDVLYALERRQAIMLDGDDIYVCT